MTNMHHSRSDQPTVFGPGCHIKGEVAIEGDAAVFGSIEGTTQITGELEVAEDGGINGDVNAGSMVLNGRVQGDVHCDGVLQLNGRIDGDVMCGKIELGSNSTLVGNLRAKIIAVNEGAIYRGEVIIGPDAMDGPAGRSDARRDAREDLQEHEMTHNGNGNGHHQEVKTTAGARGAVSGLLRKRHELLNK